MRPLGRVVALACTHAPRRGWLTRAGWLLAAGAAVALLGIGLVLRGAY